MLGSSGFSFRATFTMGALIGLGLLLLLFGRTLALDRAEYQDGISYEQLSCILHNIQEEVEQRDERLRRCCKLLRALDNENNCDFCYDQNILYTIENMKVECAAGLQGGLRPGCNRNPLTHKCQKLFPKKLSKN